MSQQFISTFFYSFLISLGNVAPFILPLLMLVLLNGLIIGRIEGWRRADAIYHAFINATTVGYGDFHPTKGASRVLSVLNAFLGLLMTGIFVGAGVYSVETALNAAY